MSWNLETRHFLIEENNKFELLINGLDNAFIKEFGCQCVRCNRETRAANTSMDFQLLDHTLQHHLERLIDVHHNRVFWGFECI